MKSRHTQTHPGLATRYQHQREVGECGEPAAARRPAHPPATHTLPARGSRHQAVEEQRGGEGGGAQKGRSPPCQLPTTTPPPAFFPPAICALRKHSPVPGRDACYLGQPGTWACACPCPALGPRVSGPNWEQVGGRAPHTLPLFGCFGSRPQPGRKAPGGGREPHGEGQLWPPPVQWEMAHWPDLIRPPSDLKRRGWGVRAVTPVATFT